jgi:hypothetical protein
MVVSHVSLVGFIAGVVVSGCNRRAVWQVVPAGDDVVALVSW